MSNPQFSSKITQRLSFGYFFVFITLGVSRSFLGPSLLEFSQNTAVGLSEISSLFIAIGLGGLTGNWVGGRLFDKLPGNIVLTCIVVCNSLLLALTPLLTRYSLLIAVIFLLGFGYGTMEAGGNTLMIWLRGKLAGPYLSIMYVFIGLGSIIIPALIGVSINLTGTLRYAFWIYGVFALPAFILLMPMPSPFPREKGDGEGKSRSDLVLIGFISLLFFFCVGSQVSFSGWIYTYAIRLNYADELSAALLSSMFWVAQTLGMLLSIPILSRVCPEKVLIADLEGGLISLIVMQLWPSPLTTWIGTIGLGISMASLLPASLAYAAQRTTITGQLNGWFLSGGSLGSMVIPWIIGQIFHSVGPNQAMWAVLITHGMACVLLLGFIGMVHHGLIIKFKKNGQTWNS